MVDVAVSQLRGFGPIGEPLLLILLFLVGLAYFGFVVQAKEKSWPVISLW